MMDKNIQQQSVTEKLEELKQQKAEVSLKIKELEETPDAKNKPIWFILIRILAIAMVGVFIANYKAGFVALGVFVLVLIMGVLDRIIAENKNRKRNKTIIALKVDESRLISAITAENAKLH